MTSELPRPVRTNSAMIATSCVLCGHDIVEELRMLGDAPVVVAVCADRSDCVRRYTGASH